MQEITIIPSFIISGKMVNLVKYNAILNFSVWLRTGYNSADYNRFGSHTGKYFMQENVKMKFKGKIRQ